MEMKDWIDACCVILGLGFDLFINKYFLKNILLCNSGCSNSRLLTSLWLKRWADRFYMKKAN